MFFLPLPANIKCPSALTLKWFPDVQWNKRTARKDKHSTQVWGGKAAAPEPQQPNRAGRASVVKTLVIVFKVTQLTPVSTQADATHQAAEVILAEEEEDLQRFALCFVSDHN